MAGIRARVRLRGHVEGVEVAEDQRADVARQRDAPAVEGSGEPFAVRGGEPCGDDAGAVSSEAAPFGRAVAGRCVHGSEGGSLAGSRAVGPSSKLTRADRPFSASPAEREKYRGCVYPAASEYEGGGPFRRVVDKSMSAVEVVRVRPEHEP